MSLIKISYLDIVANRIKYKTFQSEKELKTFLKDNVYGLNLRNNAYGLEGSITQITVIERKGIDAIKIQPEKIIAEHTKNLTVSDQINMHNLLVESVQFLIDLADNDCIITHKLPHVYKYNTVLQIQKARQLLNSLKEKE